MSHIVSCVEVKRTFETIDIYISLNDTLLQQISSFSYDGGFFVNRKLFDFFFQSAIAIHPCFFVKYTVGFANICFIFSVIFQKL